MRIAATARHRPLLQVPWRLVAGLRESEAVVWTGEQVYQVADIFYGSVNLTSFLKHLPLLGCGKVNLKDGAMIWAPRASIIVCT